MPKLTDEINAKLKEMFLYQAVVEVSDPKGPWFDETGLIEIKSGFGLSGKDSFEAMQNKISKDYPDFDFNEMQEKVRSTSRFTPPPIPAAAAPNTPPPSALKSDIQDFNNEGDKKAIRDLIDSTRAIEQAAINKEQEMNVDRLVVQMSGPIYNKEKLNAEALAKKYSQLLAPAVPRPVAMQPAAPSHQQQRGTNKPEASPAAPPTSIKSQKPKVIEDTITSYNNKFRKSDGTYTDGHAQPSRDKDGGVVFKFKSLEEMISFIQEQAAAGNDFSVFDASTGKPMFTAIGGKLYTGDGASKEIVSTPSPMTPQPSAPASQQSNSNLSTAADSTSAEDNENSISRHGPS